MIRKRILFRVHVGVRAVDSIARQRQRGLVSRAPIPSPVAVIAKTHWIVGATIAVTTSALFVFARILRVELNSLTFIFSFSLAGLYGLAGALVWLGLPPGRLLSQICSLLYLPRQDFGMHIFRIMRSDEFKAHF